MKEPSPGTRRLLILLPFPPRLDADHGGAKTIAAFLHHLPSRYEVAAIYLRSNGEPPPDDEMRARCSVLVEVDRPGPSGTHGLAGLAGRLARGVRILSGLAAGRPPWATRWRVAGFEMEARRVASTWNPDLIQAEFSVMGQYLAPLGSPGVPRVLTVHEPGMVAAAHRGKGSRGLARGLVAIQQGTWSRYERRLIDSAEAVVAFTAEDLEVMKSLSPGGGRTCFTIIPFGVVVPESLPPRPADLSPVILFIGNYRHPPNLVAAERLVTAIFPEVRRQVPDVRLRLIGPNLPPGLQGLDGQGVETPGFVADLRPHMQDASVIVAPMRTGGGMRVKVLEALASGRPLVSTRLAAAGLDVTDGKELLLADSDRELADAIVALLRDPALAADLGEAGREWVGRNSVWSTTVEAYESLYARLIDG